MKQIITHYSDGNVFFEYNQDDQERKQGLYVKYFNNPHVPEESHNYVDNVLHGEFLQYALTNGKAMLILKCNYINGKLDGMYQTWCGQSGRPLSIINYKKGKKNGEYLEFYKNGDLFKKYKYIDNKLISPSKSWFESGKVELEFNDKTLVKYDKSGKNLEKQLYDKNYNVYYKIIYNQEGIVEEEQEYKNDKNVKRIFFNHFWRFGIFSDGERVTKIVDFEAKTQIIIPNKKPNMRVIYNLNVDYIRTETLDEQGNIIPTVWTRMKEFLCSKKYNTDTDRDNFAAKPRLECKYNEYKKRYGIKAHDHECKKDEEELQLMNTDSDHEHSKYD